MKNEDDDTGTTPDDYGETGTGDEDIWPGADSDYTPNGPTQSDTDEANRFAEKWNEVRRD